MRHKYIASPASYINGFCAECVSPKGNTTHLPAWIFGYMPACMFLWMSAWIKDSANHSGHMYTNLRFCKWKLGDASRWRCSDVLFVAKHWRRPPLHAIVTAMSFSFPWYASVAKYASMVYSMTIIPANVIMTFDCNFITEILVSGFRSNGLVFSNKSAGYIITTDHLWHRRWPLKR